MDSVTDCPICLEIIYKEKNDEYIIFECCHQLVHISCLKDWVKSKENRNKSACILCGIESEFLYDFYSNLNLNTQNLIVDISNVDISAVDISAIDIDDNASNTTDVEIRIINISPFLLHRPCIYNSCTLVFLLCMIGGCIYFFMFY